MMFQCYSIFMNIQKVYLESINSTNLYAKEHLELSKPDTLVAIHTSYQTAGLGTKQRSWLSNKNENLLVTFLYEYRKNQPLFQYTQVLSVAIIHYLASLGLIAQIKWANDILLNNCKLAGILAEPQSESNRMVIGLGLNVNMTNFDPIDQPATSILAASQTEHKVEDVLDGIAENFANQLTIYHREGFEPILNSYIDHLAYINQPIVWENTKGILRSVSREGYLLFEDEHHQIQTIRSGSIRLQGK